jgi:hypothetical protein
VAVRHRELVRKVGTLEVCHVVTYEALQYSGYALSPDLQVMHSLVRVVPTDLRTGIPERLGMEPTGGLRVVMGDCVEGAGDGVITVHGGSSEQVVLDPVGRVHGHLAVMPHGLSDRGVHGQADRQGANWDVSCESPPNTAEPQRSHW